MRVDGDTGGIFFSVSSVGAASSVMMDDDGERDLRTVLGGVKVDVTPEVGVLSDVVVPVGR